jgi:tetratricopeptide (TPR) repeat protein
VLVTGLGCSELAGAPGWVPFIEWLAGRLVFSDARATVVKLVEAGRLADATALIRDLLPHSVLEEAIKEAYPGGAPIPDSVGLVAEFPWRAVVATDFDDLWARALSAAAGAGSDRPPPRILVGTDPLAEARMGGSGTTLLHLFGRAAVPESLCLGPGDWRARLVPAGGLGWLDDLRRRRSLVFLGFRPADPDFAWLTAWLSASAPGSDPHFIFLDLSAESDPDTEALLVGLRTGISVIPCLEGTAEAIERLSSLAREVGATLAPSDAEIDLEAWLRRWTEDPSDPEPREVLARAEVALRNDERWDRLIELLLRRLDLQDDPEQQMAALEEVARIFRELLAAPHRALTAGIAALRIRPADDTLWEGLRADAGAAGAWRQLATDATEVARAAGPTPATARIWREVARVWWQELGRVDEALAAYREALVAEPGHREARDEQAEVLRQAERWGELVSVLHESAAETTDATRAAAIMLEAAEVLEARVGNAGGAIADYQAALAIAADSATAEGALERLYEQERRWGELAEHLARRAARLPPGSAEAGKARQRRAEIMADHLDFLEQASEELEAVVQADPGDRSALQLLGRIYQRAERHDDYLRVLRREADLTSTQAERLAILRRVASEGEARPEGLDRAAEALEQVLLLEPRDPDAFPALSRIYRAARRPAALAAVQSRRLEVTETAEAKRELLLSLAERYERELDDPEKALEAYSAVEKAGDRREPVYEAITRLAERLGRWQRCVEALQKWGEIATDVDLRAEVLLQAALMFYDRLGDREAAEGQLVRLLQVAPANPKALSALARMRRDGGDLEQTAQLLIDAAAREESPAARAELLSEAASVIVEDPAQEDRAVDLYTRALAANPDQPAANERLVEIHSARGQWDEVEALLDIQARAAESRQGAGADADADADADKVAGIDRVVAIQTRLAGACLEIGKEDKALRCLARAYELRPESLPVLRTYAELRAGRREWKEARELYASMLRVHREGLTPAELIPVTIQLGRCHAELAELDDAVRCYREARELDPQNRQALEALFALHHARQDWAAWVREGRVLVALVAGDQKAQLWEELGDVYAERLGDSEQAEEAFRAALSVDEGRQSALHKLLELYTREKRWEQATEMLGELARLESDPEVRAESLYNAALIWRDGLGRPAEAIALLERCLESAPSMTAAFDALETLQREAGDWKALARSYRRMIKRLPTDASPGLRLSLWSRLGDVALERLNNGRLAMTALEAAISLDPGDIPRQETLARLYELAGPDARDRAIAAHQRLLARDPNRLESYRALAKLYGEMGDLDKQWSVAAAMSFLGRADPSMESLFQRHRPGQVRPAQHRFTEETWQRIRHPDEDPLLDRLFAVTAPYLAVPAAQPPDRFGLRRRQQVDLASDPSPATRALVQLTETMGLAKPDLFLMDGPPGQTALLNLQHRGQLRPTLVLGPSTLRRRSFDLIFDLSTYLAFLRPDRFLRYAVGGPEDLEVGLLAMLGLAGAPVDPQAGKGQVVALAAYLQRTIPGPTLTQLAAAGRKLMETRGREIDLGKWIAATHLSAARAALALTGDLAAAARVITSEPLPLAALPTQRRLADLVAFSVSDDYFACRGQLGLEVV